MDRDNEETEGTKSPSAVKEIDWNIVVIALSSIMVLIGIPSMFSACFSPHFMHHNGTMIFLICASLSALILGYLYVYIPFAILKIPFSGCAFQVSRSLIALGVAFIPLTIYYLLTDQLGLVIFWSINVIFIVLLGMGVALISTTLGQNKISKRRLVGLFLLSFGLIICLICMSKTIVLAVIFFGNVCLILDFIFPISIYLMLLL